MSVSPTDISSHELARRHLPLSEQIARRLCRRYGWVSFDDLKGYAFLGLSLAARMYDRRRGVPFDRFACRKAMFLAIDEMRKDGLLRRADAPTLKLEPNSPEGELELPDPGSDRESQRLEAREFCGRLLQRLSEPERSLLEMIYSDKLAYKEIASIFQISESAVCLRHKAVLAKLRRQATVRRAA